MQLTLGELERTIGMVGRKASHDEEAAADIALGWMHMAIQRVMRGYSGEFMRTLEASH